MVAPIATGKVDADQLVLLLLVDLQEDAVRSSAEMGMGAVTDDPHRLAAGGGDPEDAGLLRPATRGEAAASGQLVDDRRSVRREFRPAIMAGLARYGAHAAAVGSDGPDLAKPLVIPRDERDPAPVPRPARPELEIAVLGGQRPRRAAARHVADVKPAERLEDDAAAIRRDRGEARHAGREAVGRDLDLRAWRLDDDAGGGSLEGDLGGAAAVDIDAPELAARPEDEAAAVGSPAHVRVDPVDRPGLLEVTVESGIDLMLLARAQVLDEQPALAA